MGTRAWARGLPLALLALLVSGCREEKLTLRGAETMAYAWLDDLRPLVAAAGGPAASPRPAGESATPVPVSENAAPGSQAAPPVRETPQNATARNPQAAAGGHAQTLRDCFVNDGWNAEGFKNPTEAVTWLQEEPRAISRVTSISLLEGGKGAEVKLDLRGREGLTSVVAHVVDEEGTAKCNYLKR